MDWIPLISATLRLGDMHDSSQDPASATKYNLHHEQRCGRSDGLWLDVAIGALEYLRLQEEYATGGFVPGTKLRESLVERVPGMTEGGVMFVLSALSTPAEIWYVEPMADGSRPLKSSKNTNLVERSRTADAYRLTSVGKLATALASSVKDIAYIAGSAKNMLTAIKLGEFGKIPELSMAMSDTLRGFRLDVEAKRESNRGDEILEFFKEKGSVIHEQIREAVAILREADDFLGLVSTRGMFKAWEAGMDQQGRPTFGMGYAAEQIRKVADQTLRLLDSFMGLIQVSSTQDDAGFRPISFIQLSRRLSGIPPSDDVYRMLLASYGPTRIFKAYPCPFDFRGVVEPERQDMPSEIDKDEEGVPAGASNGVGFVEKHKEEILASLRGGPLSITDALKKGWIVFDPDGLKDVEQLVGTYCDPVALDRDARIAICLKEDERVPVEFGSLAEFAFSNLVMVME